MQSVLQSGCRSELARNGSRSGGLPSAYTIATPSTATRQHAGHRAGVTFGGRQVRR